MQLIALRNVSFIDSPWQVDVGRASVKCVLGAFGMLLGCTSTISLRGRCHSQHGKPSQPDKPCMSLQQPCELIVVTPAGHRWRSGSCAGGACSSALARRQPAAAAHAAAEALLAAPRALGSLDLLGNPARGWLRSLGAGLQRPARPPARRAAGRVARAGAFSGYSGSPCGCEYK